VGRTAREVDGVLPNWSFFRWAGGAYVVVTTWMVVGGLRVTGGRLVYALDDPAIHLSLATRIAKDGTWGVVPGVFQSASSSPVWTGLLAVVARVAPSVLTAAPLGLSALAALWAVAVLGIDQQVLVPGIRRPLHVIATVALTCVVLLFPALTMLGMEHVLHIALVLSVLVLFARRMAGRPSGWPAWLPFVLLGVATVVRFETAFLALGLGIAILLVPRPVGSGSTGWSPRRREAALVGAASAAPLVVFAAGNRLMGQGWLPNSVLAKSNLGGSEGEGIAPAAIWHRFVEDPLLAGLALAMAVVIVVGWRRRLAVTGPAVAVAVTIACHVVMADVGWYDRYQTYLVALASWVVLAAASTALVGERGVRLARFLGPGLVAVALVLGGPKVALTLDVTDAVADTWDQRYQAAMFLDRFYDGEPVATGELGYISLLHRGPITDLYGLGDFEVLQERLRVDGPPSKRYWSSLAQRRGFDVAVVYPYTLLVDTPDEWILVGEWTIDRPVVTAFQPTLQFWATRPDEVSDLKAHLHEFERVLPDEVHPSYDDLAEYRAAQVAEAGGP
jgi:hypothetical protein